MPALLLQSEAGGMLTNGFTVLCLLSPGRGVERSSGSLPGRPNAGSSVAGTCPRATPVSRRSAVGMAHKRSIRLQCMMSFPTVSLLLFQPSFLFQPICSDSIRAPGILLTRAPTRLPRCHRVAAQRRSAHTPQDSLRDSMLGSCCACAKEAPAHSSVTRTARHALPVELGMDRYNHRNATKNERSTGVRSGTARPFPL